MALHAQHHGSVQVRPVDSAKDLDLFIRVPWAVYAKDPAWIPPLLLERKQHLSPRNPFFKHAVWQGWIAHRNGQPVGRISAQIDRLHQEHHGSHSGFFGMLEAEDDPETFAALFGCAENWLSRQGIRTVSGPFNLSINEECGLLVEGLDTPPSIMMGHARPYYPAYLESHGYSQAQDLLAYHVRPDFDAPAVMEALIRKTMGGVRVRPLRRSRLKQELQILREIFNDAWSENWGFVPFTAEEFEEIGRTLTLLVDNDFVQIAELDQEPVAMIIALPNINEVIRGLNGRLLPFGWAKLLWRLKVRYPSSARVPLMGVRKRLQHTRRGPALAFLVIDAVRQALIRRGVQDVEMSWILDGNAGMRNIIESIGGTPYKRYRIYSKSLHD